MGALCPRQQTLDLAADQGLDNWPRAYRVKRQQVVACDLVICPKIGKPVRQAASMPRVDYIVLMSLDDDHRRRHPQGINTAHRPELPEFIEHGSSDAGFVSHQPARFG